MPSREVRLSSDYDYPDYAAFQANFIDQRTGLPMPSTKVYVGDELRVTVNSLGCIDRELEPGVPVVAVFGDSYIQGLRANCNWPSLLDIPGCQGLNAAVEGMPLQRIVDRFLSLRDRTPMVCAAVHSGWHNLIYGETAFTVWERELLRVQGVPVIAHFRLTADVNAEMAERGYDALYSDTYHPIRHTQDIRTVKELWKQMEQKNRLIERICQEHGRVLINLDEVLAPATYEDVTKKFFDAMHPRPEVYPEIAAAVSAQLRPHVERALERMRVPAASAPHAGGRAPDPQRESNYNYPLW